MKGWKERVRYPNERRQGRSHSSSLLARRRGHGLKVETNDVGVSKDDRVIEG